MRKSTNGEYYMRSGFQTAYFLIFVYAAYRLTIAMTHSDNMVRQGMDKISILIRQQGHDLWLINNVVNAAIPVFSTLFALHLLRIYVTLEAMEDEEGMFDRFYDDYGGIARFIEWTIKVVIIGLVSLEIVPIHGFYDFASYVFLVYLSVVAWSVLAIARGKSAAESFIFSSTAGLIIGIALSTIFNRANQASHRSEDDTWQIAVCFLWAANAYLLFDLLIYAFYKSKSKPDEKINIVKIGKNLWKKFTWTW